MLAFPLSISNHYCPATQGQNKDLASWNATRTTVLLLLKLKVRSISTSQQNGPQNRWLRIILAYTSSPYWIKVSLLCISYWGQRSLEKGGSSGSSHVIILSGASILHWEQNSFHWSERNTGHSWGAVNSRELAWWCFYSKDTSLSALPSHHL